MYFKSNAVVEVAMLREQLEKESGPGRCRPFTLLADPGQPGHLVCRIWATVVDPGSVRGWRCPFRSYNEYPGNEGAEIGD